MRHVLAVLRPDDVPALAPQPGLDALPELVTRIESGGVSVRFSAKAPDLPTGLALTVYRLVQESLTNVLKHAGPGVAAEVTIAEEDGALRVSVRDDGHTRPAHPLPTAAHGIVGMRERVAAYSGTFRAGPRSGGGFEVEAVIPFVPQGSQP